MLTLTNIARKANNAPGMALRGRNREFEERFRAMEGLPIKHRLKLREQYLDAQERM